MIRLVLVLTITVAGCGTTTEIPAASALDRTLPAVDAVDLDIDVVPIPNAPAHGYLPELDALVAARADWGKGGDAEAFLQLVTDPSMSKSSTPINKRALWIVRWSNFSMTSPGGRLLTRAYAYLDARTGQILQTRYR